MCLDASLLLICNIEKSFLAKNGEDACIQPEVVRNPTGDRVSLEVYWLRTSVSPRRTAQ